MSLASQLANLATRVGTEFKSVRASIGSLTSLATTEKGSIVAAINEIKAGVEAGGNITADAITDATVVGKNVLKAANAAAARTAIGAGTGNSNLAIGTTASDAKAGNYVPAWGEITGKPAVIAAGADQATARAAIGAGTSNLAIGTTGTTAKAGNYVPAWDDIASKPVVIAAGADASSARAAIGAGTGNSNLVIGTTGTTAKAGNYVPTWSEVTSKPAVIASGADQASARAAIGAQSAAEVDAKIAALVNGAGATLDTLKELADALGGDANFATTMSTALGNRVRVDAAQAFTEPQKLQARSNIDVYSKTEIGNPEADLVATFEAALV